MSAATRIRAYSPLPLLLTACLLQVAAIANIYVRIGLMLAAIVSGLILWSARPVLASRAWRQLSLLLVVNLVAQALYVWTTQERTHIVVRVDTERGFFRAETNQNQRRNWPALEWTWDVEGRPRPTGGGIALWLPDRAYSAHDFFRYPDHLLGKLAARIDATRAHPTWDNIVVRDNATGKVLWQSTFDQGQEQGWRDPAGRWSVNQEGEYTSSSRAWTFVGADDWTNYTVEADIVRARNVVGMAVLTKQDTLSNGAFVLIQPWNEAWQWGTWQNEESFSLRGPWRWFRKPLVAQLQDVLSLYLKSWQYAILIAMLVTLGTCVLALRPRSRPVSTTGFISRLRATSDRVTASPPAGNVVAGAKEAAPHAGIRALHKPRHEHRIFYAAVGLSGLLAVIVTSVLCLVFLEGIPHVQDSVAYFFQAKILAMGRWYVPLPSSPEFFAHEYVAQHEGKWFSIYQPGYPILLALGMLIRMPWLVNPLLGGGALVFLALAGRRMFRERVGLLAAILGLSSPFFLQLTASFMSHATGCFFIALFLYCLVRMEQQPGEAGPGRWLIPLLSGVGAAWTFITRPFTAVLLVAPFVLYFGIVIWRRPMWWRWLFALVGGLPVLSLMLIFNWRATGDPLKNTWTLSGSGNRLGFAQQGVGMRDGHSLSDGLFNTTVNTLELMRHLYGWPLFVTLALLLLPFALGAARRWDWLLLGSAASLVIGYVAYWPPGIMYGPRYYYEMLPALLLLTARGADTAAQRAGQVAQLAIRRRQRGEAGWVFVAFLLVGLLTLNLTGYLPLQIRLLEGYNYTNADRIQAVADAGVHNALIFVQGSEQDGWWTYGSVFPQNDPLLRGDVIYARDLGDDRNVELAAEFPGRTTYRLSSAKQLVPLNYSASGLPASSSTGVPRTIGREGTAPGEFKQARAIAISADGRLFVADTGNKRIQVLTGDGAYISMITGGEEPFVEPLDLVTTSNGELVVLDSEPGWLYHFDQNGMALGRIGGPAGQFFHPRGLSIDASDNLYIADTGRGRVVKMSLKGEILQVIDGDGSNPGQLTEPTDAAVARDGSLFVAEAPDGRVKHFTQEGRYLGEFAIPPSVALDGPHLAFAPDQSLLVTSPELGSAQQYDAAGKLLRQWTAEADGMPGLKRPIGIAVTRDSVWLVDIGDHQVKILPLGAP